MKLEFINQKTRTFPKGMKLKARNLVKSNRYSFGQNAVNNFSNIIGKRGAYSNCWGTTLFALGVIEAPRYVDDDVMLPWLQEQTSQVPCPSTSNVLAIYGKKGELEHTAIYLGDGLYWHQEGFTGPHLIQTLPEILKTYPGVYEFREYHGA